MSIGFSQKVVRGYLPDIPQPKENLMTYETASALYLGSKTAAIILTKYEY